MNTNDRSRVLFLDIIRGIAVINMVAYHLLYDLVYIFGVEISWFGIRKGFVWEQFICFTFILVAGIGVNLSRALWRNGLRLCGCALILTAVTLTVIPTEGILFGILHFLGCAILLTWVGRPLLRRIPGAVGFIVSLLLFILLRNIVGGSIGIAGLMEWRLPEWLYENRFMFVLGLPAAGFSSADYFPILPWFFLFLTGYFGGRRVRAVNGWLTERTGLSQSRGYRLGEGSLGAVGRKSLWIYMAHQPIIYGGLLLAQRWGWI